MRVQSSGKDAHEGVSNPTINRTLKRIRVILRSKSEQAKKAPSCQCDFKFAISIYLISVSGADYFAKVIR